MNFINEYILSFLIFFPLVTAALILALPRELAKLAGFLGSLAVFFGGMHLWYHFAPATTGLQFVETYSWMADFGIQYFVGVDGLNLLLVVLTAFLTPLVLLTLWKKDDARIKGYFSLILLLETGMMGALLAFDLVFFYVFWELMLIPMYFIIGLWGGARRIYATTKFVIYTVVGSLFMLIAALVLYHIHYKQTGFYSTSLLDLYKVTLPYGTELWLFVAFALAFAIKVPMFPFHTWLPDAHVEAPTAGSVVLAALLLKMGGYGLFRIIVPMLPSVDKIFVTIIAIIAVLSIVYGAFLALAQKDIKKLVAYSSVSHMGFVTLGAVALVPLSIQGAMFQQFSHGIITCVLFMSAGTIQHVVGTRIIADLGGLADRMPKFAVIMMAGFMASLGLPGMSGFVAEFMTLTGAYATLPVYVMIVVFLSIVITAAYHLWAMQKAMFGPILRKYMDVHDPHAYELFSMSMIILLTLLFGLQPGLMTDMMGTAANQLLQPVVTLSEMGVI